MKINLLCFSLFLLSSIYQVSGQDTPKNLDYRWISENLNEKHPRLIFTEKSETTLKLALKEDENVQNFYSLVKKVADEALNEPLIKNEKQGRRLLFVSRKLIQRNLSLAMAYRIEGNPRYLERLEKELLNVCSFPNWNPAHFLDVAEMAVAVALPYDWLFDELSEETKAIIRNALVDKAFKPSISVNKAWNWWWNADFNWNLVCHGGLAVAALAIYEDEPEFSSHILDRTYQKFPLGFKPYFPDGAYNEGPGYWFYATNYLVLTLAAFESALGTTFDFENTQGIKESVLFMEETAGPSGDYFNYFDASLKGYRNLSHIGLSAWFASKMGSTYLEEAIDLNHEWDDMITKSMGRFTSVYSIFLAKVPKSIDRLEIPNAWLAKGESPVGVLRSSNPEGIYVATKGGSAFDNHGNMDAGSFILEWKNKRFVVDPGNQDYGQLEKVIGVEALWSKEQNSKRWDLLTKNNFGHSTLSINEQKHLVEARSLIVDANLNSEQPSFGINLTPQFGAVLDTAIRSFKLINDEFLQITDKIKTNESTQDICWQLITQSKVKKKKDGIYLIQDDAKLEIDFDCELPFEIKVVSLDPPPLDYDKKIEGLKRVELTIKNSSMKNQNLLLVTSIRGK